MNPAEKLLNHLDRITGSQSGYVQVSDKGAHPAVYAAIYNDFPTTNSITGFTVGLSHFHPPGGSHKELTISMQGTDNSWALAGAFLAFQLRNRCPFKYGDTINFKEKICKTSSMSAFVAVPPLHVSLPDMVIDIGVRKIELVQLIPIYEEERKWFNDGGTINVFMDKLKTEELSNPRRAQFVSL